MKTLEEDYFPRKPNSNFFGMELDSNYENFTKWFFNYLKKSSLEGVSFEEIEGDLPENLKKLIIPPRGLELRILVDYFSSKGKIKYCGCGKYCLA
jgi:hypothetical protein